MNKFFAIFALAFVGSAFAVTPPKTPYSMECDTRIADDGTQMTVPIYVESESVSYVAEDPAEFTTYIAGESLYIAQIQNVNGEDIKFSFVVLFKNKKRAELSTYFSEVGSLQMTPLNDTPYPCTITQE